MNPPGLTASDSIEPSPRPFPPTGSSHGRALTLGAVLTLVTLAVFWPVVEYDFVNFDDPKYVSENQTVLHGLTWEGVRWAFTTTHASNWHPLTWLSHMLDEQLFGPRPWGHHLANAFFHAINTGLLFLVLRRLTGAVWRSAFVAALFGLHPLHVESVAWISERKDVLSTFFFLLTLVAWARRNSEFRIQNSKLKGQTSKDGPPTSNLRPTVLWYWGALISFALGLMCKPMLVTLPFVLLLLDYWPLQRLLPIEPGARSGLGRLILEKLPFFALSLASSMITFWAQQKGGAVASLDYTPLLSRLSTAIMGYWGYLEKTVWPTKLAVLYLAPKEWPLEQLLVGTTALILLSVGAIALRRSHRFIAVGWFWFLGMLAPVIGIIQVGNQSMADRYTYLPLIGLFIIVAWGTWELARHRHQAVLTFTGLLIVLGFAARTSDQLHCWTDGEALFTQCVRATTGNYVAHSNLGNVLARRGKYAEAKLHYLESLRIQPHYANAMRNLGVLLTQQGQIDEALGYLRQATSLAPESAVVYGDLAQALAIQGNFESAIIYYHESLNFQPDQVEVCNNLAWLLATRPEGRLRNGQEAVQLAERACALTGYKTIVLLGTLAAAYAEAGRFTDAIATAEKAIGLAAATGRSDLEERNRQLLKLYRANQPYREPAQEN